MRGKDYSILPGNITEKKRLKTIPLPDEYPDALQ
jgi:hypothetical protein